MCRRGQYERWDLDKHLTDKYNDQPIPSLDMTPVELYHDDYIDPKDCTETGNRIRYKNQARPE
jgi:hypothetical protein